MAAYPSRVAFRLDCSGGNLRHARFPWCPRPEARARSGSGSACQPRRLAGRRRRQRPGLARRRLQRRDSAPASGTAWARPARTSTAPTGNTLVSRLSYKGLTGGSGEVFGQINERNYFVKGVAGLGALLRGSLQDEDFAPVTSPYSSTDSTLHEPAISATSRSTAAPISPRRPMPASACSPATASCTRR